MIWLADGRYQIPHARQNYKGAEILSKRKENGAAERETRKH